MYFGTTPGGKKRRTCPFSAARAECSHGGPQPNECRGLHAVLGHLELYLASKSQQQAANVLQPLIDKDEGAAEWASYGERRERLNLGN